MMPARTLIGSIALALLLTATSAYSAIIYVKWDATGANNGTSWADAYTDLHTALGAADPYDDIWVAAGTYKPTSGLRRQTAFQIDSLNVYGGFAGMESSIEERDIPANPTILSGDIGAPNIDTDNSFNVVRSVVEESFFTLDGFTIRDGKADSSLAFMEGGGGWFEEPRGAVFQNLIVEDNQSMSSGGGFSVKYCDECAWDNVIFRNNEGSYGGGLNHQSIWDAENHHMSNTVFEGNFSSREGGGAHLEYMTLIDVIATGNEADAGGGFYLMGDCVLTRVTITGNHALEGGGGISEIWGPHILTDCVFRSNSAHWGGGLKGYGVYATNTDFIGNRAIESNGGAVYLTSSSYAEFVSCTMDSNSAVADGGAVIIYGGDPSFVLCRMRDNTARRGGAIAVTGASTVATVTQGEMIGNVATNFEGGALYAAAGGEIIAGSSLITDNSAVRFGGGAYVANGMITLVNSTLYGNSAGIRGGGAASFSEGTITVSNSILWNNSALYNPECYYNDPLSFIIIDHSDVKGSGGSESWDISFGTDAGGNIDIYPAFVDTTGGDFHLSSSSPCIEVGDKFNPYLPSEDLDGNPRVQGVNPDMGCYESSSYCPGVTRLYVNQVSAVSGPGTSWIVAHHLIEDALLAAQLCPGITEIWVAEGTYHPTTSGDRGESFALLDSVAVYGGFAGTETSLSERELSDHTTILSGEIGAAGVEDNSYHVVSCSNVSGETVLDGFTITGGNADQSYPNDRGGGMYNFAGEPTIRNVIFDGNAALSEGGGLSSILGAGVRLINVLFTGNNALQNGGALANSAHPAVLTNVTFYGNSSVLGAVIYNNNCNPEFTNCILWGNPVALMYNMNSNPTFSHCIVEDSGGSGSWDSTIGTDLGNNLDTNPMFINAGGGDLHLPIGSPAVDAGDNAAPFIASEDLDGMPRILNGTVDMGPYECDNVTGLGDPPPVLAFHGIYPNPFNPTLTIAYELDRARDVHVAIYTVRGERVRTLLKHHQPPGPHRIQWNGTNDHGQRVASGIYLIVVKSEGWRVQHKAVLLK